MKYDVILADPPWEYSNKKTGGTHMISGSADHYPVMSIDEICQILINKITKANSALFLWITNPLIFVTAPLIFNAWGFEYKTKAFCWVKSWPTGMGFARLMGFYTRGNTEDCLLAIKGKMPVRDHGIGQIIYAPIIKHSQKPDDQYRKIEALYPDVKYLELFARKKRVGWDSWGNEIESDITL